MFKLRMLLFTVPVVAASLCACSRSAPDIAYYTMELLYFQTKDASGSSFSFFVLPDDPDGFSDIKEVTLYNDADCAKWTLNKDNWVTFDVDGKKWVGSHSLAMPDYARLPSGKFRITVTDAGGESAEKVFGFDVPAKPKHPFPKLTIEHGSYHIICKYPELSFLVYNEGGGFLKTIAIAAKDGTLASLRLPSDAKQIALWARDSELKTSAVTDVLWLE
jgi:hypothetical protein